jgi:hypothetical protein
MTFYVIDVSERSVTWPARDDADKGESFTTMKAAQKRAEERATWEPGKIFSITQTIVDVVCQVGKPQITKR